MIKNVSKVVFAHPGDIVSYTISLKAKQYSHANFSIENANPGGYWGSSIGQLPKDVVAPNQIIVTPFSGVVHEGEPTKAISIKYLYPTWIRVVQYLSGVEQTSVTAKIKINTTLFNKIKRFWLDQIEPPTERIF